MNNNIILTYNGECYNLTVFNNLTLTPPFCVERDCDFNVILPTKAHNGDAGFDLYSPLFGDDGKPYKFWRNGCKTFCHDEDICVKPGQRVCVPTGLKMKICENWFLKIDEKSGLARNNGVQIIGGICDSSYTGIIHINIFNCGEEDFMIVPGMKLAQAILIRCDTNKFIPFKMIDNYITDLESQTTRANQGFGSTGS
jgi:deoxyuridine 5'-triphosphate nucleotidohydrolase